VCGGYVGLSVLRAREGKGLEWLEQLSDCTHSIAPDLACAYGRRRQTCVCGNSATAGLGGEREEEKGRALAGDGVQQVPN